MSQPSCRPLRDAAPPGSPSAASGPTHAGRVATRSFQYSAGRSVTQWILASDGHPFRDRDAAQIKRDLLLSELGAAVDLDVISHPSGGFAVSVHRTPIVSAPAGEHGPPGRTQVREELLDPDLSPREVLLRTLGRSEPAVPIPPSPGVTDTYTYAESDSASPSKTASPAHGLAGSEHYPESFRLSPAGRAFLGLHLQALFGGLLLFQPHLVFVITGLGLPQPPTAGAIMLAATAACGALLAVFALSRFLWTYTANTYLVDRDGVEQVQWYFEKGRLRRRAPRVNFAHLRSADVDQSVLQMLFNVGSLKLAAGATDNYEVVLRHITAPRALQREFQRRLQNASEFTRRSRPGGDL